MSREDNMKYITFAVPCYNSESYMDRCVETLLTGGNRVEIVLVDDGSSDRTAEIADRYHEKYPDIIKVVHQPNSGHGEGVNQGLRNATGKYSMTISMRIPATLSSSVRPSVPARSAPGTIWASLIRPST